jgi:hypothetical protein
MTPRAEEVTVLIPTRAATERETSLRQAVESVLCQEGVSARVLLLLNGAENEPQLSASRLTDLRLTILRRRDANLPAALQQGARAVETPWFAALDDDDELLPGALKLRLHALARHPDRLVVAGNGYRRDDGVDTLHVANGEPIRTDPLRALLDRNWLLPGSWLCRTTPATTAIFDHMPRHLECTYLAIRFAALGMIWIDDPTVVYNVNTPLSARQSRAYVEGQAEALRHILELELPDYARRELTSRIAAAHHRAANLSLAKGELKEALRCHLATLRSPGGWRHLPFARHLIGAAIRGRR